jgi:hypothetical protein
MNLRDLENQAAHLPRTTTLLLWTPFVLAPVAWAFHLQVVYAASLWVCEGETPLSTLHAISAGCFALAVAAGLFATWQWWTAGAQVSSQHDWAWKGRIRFLSMQGMLVGALFALVIVAQWSAIFYLPPCPP